MGKEDRFLRSTCLHKELMTCFCRNQFQTKKLEITFWNFIFRKIPQNQKTGNYSLPAPNIRVSQGILVWNWGFITVFRETKQNHIFYTFCYSRYMNFDLNCDPCCVTTHPVIKRFTQVENIMTYVTLGFPLTLKLTAVIWLQYCLKRH